MKIAAHQFKTSFTAELAARCSADWQSAVSPTGSRQGRWFNWLPKKMRHGRRLPACDTADCQSALQRHPQRAFTLVEIAICLGIIGVALVAIIGILPIGMHTQRDSREETIVGQDASVLFEAVRSGSRGADDLTNYVYAIVNTGTNSIGYTNSLATRVGFKTSWFAPKVDPGNWHNVLTNGANIIGLMSTPEFIDGRYDPTNNPSPAFSASNHIVAYVSAMSGVVSEKPPQDNDILRQDAFGYRVYCVNAPVAVDTNNFSYATNNFVRIYADKLARNQHELRMTFLWPLLPSGNTGNGRQTFRATIAGQLVHVFTNGVDFYYYQSQSFTNAP